MKKAGKRRDLGREEEKGGRRKRDLASLARPADGFFMSRTSDPGYAAIFSILMKYQEIDAQIQIFADQN